MLHAEAIITGAVEKQHFAANYFKGADLSGQDLSNYCFVRANLTKTKMTGCDLSRADFCGAIMQETDMSGCDLDHTRLNSADLRGANIAHWKADIMGCHTRGILLDYRTVDASTIIGAHDCHELVVSALLYEYPGDDDIQWICDCILARNIACWHGLIKRVRKTYPHRIADLQKTFARYPNMELLPRWQLGELMADCKTADDWLALRKTPFYTRWPGLIDGWMRKSVGVQGNHVKQINTP